VMSLTLYVLEVLTTQSPVFTFPLYRVYTQRTTDVER